MPALEEVRCCVCGEIAVEENSVPGVGRVCPECLMSGNFLGSSSTLRLSFVVERLLQISTTVQSLLADSIQDAEHQAQNQQFDLARSSFITIARKFMDDGRQLLAILVLSRALRLPGQAAEVYETLGEAAQSLDCRKEAIQYLKTASWLAIKSDNFQLGERVLALLEELVPADSWAKKARGQLDERQQNDAPTQSCHFCGRTALDAGPLISGEEAAVCGGCVKRLMSLDGDVH
ncbi:MAG: hypothetical protein JRJ87_21810 [Deltaproteobacteria bacterium]|nr:hypothetical protein [Deltaproteobacteria bacterium]